MGSKIKKKNTRVRHKQVGGNFPDLQKSAVQEAVKTQEKIL